MGSGFVTSPIDQAWINMQNDGLRGLEACWSSRYCRFTKSAYDAVKVYLCIGLCRWERCCLRAGVFCFGQPCSVTWHDSVDGACNTSHACRDRKVYASVCMGSYDWLVWYRGMIPNRFTHRIRTSRCQCFVVWE